MKVSGYEIAYSTSSKFSEATTKIVTTEDKSTTLKNLKAGKKYYVNLKELNALSLRMAGVKRIEVSDACTVCQSDRFWSHRVTRGDRGSQGALIRCMEGSK